MPDDFERRKHSLTREDLTILLDSYKNMIESNLQLMEKQEQILTKIGDACMVFDKLRDELVSGFKVFSTEMIGVHNHHQHCKEMQERYNQTLKDLLSEDHEEVKGILHNDHMEVTKTHFGQNLKFYGLIGALCTIILGLVGLIYKLWPVAKIVPTP